MTAEVKKFFSKEESRQAPGACMKSSLRRFFTAIIAAVLISTPVGVLFLQTPPTLDLKGTEAGH